jgi:hypothetical protein
MNSNFKVHPTFTKYAVSRDGEVYSLITNKKLKPKPDGNGYLKVVLRKDKKAHTRMVNRLVLQTYNPIENDHLYHAHHENRIRNDNRLENLEWELKADHLSEHHKGKVVSEETKRKIGEGNKGKVRSDDFKRNLSEKKVGVKRSEETRRRMSKAHKGHPITEETRRKISEAKKGRVLSEETKKKMGEAKIGIKKSEETKKKMGEAKKGMKWWNNGTKTIRSKECPGEGWIRGRIMS